MEELITKHLETDFPSLYVFSHIIRDKNMDVSCTENQKKDISDAEQQESVQTVLASLRKVVPVFILNEKGNDVMLPFVQIIRMIVEKNARDSGTTSKSRKKSRISTSKVKKRLIAFRALNKSNGKGQ